MFYSYDWLCRRKNGKFSIVWLAATHIKKLTNQDVMKVPRDSSTGKRPRFSLYLSSQLLYGVCVIRQKQLKMFLDEISNFFISVHSTKWTIDLQTEKRQKKKHGEKRGEDDLLIDIQRKKQKLDIGVLPPDLPEQVQTLTFPNVVDDHLMELPTLGELPVEFLNGDLDALLRSMTEDLREHVERPPVIEPLREDTTLLSMKQSLLDPSTSDATGEFLATDPEDLGLIPCASKNVSVKQWVCNGVKLRLMRTNEQLLE
uniref:Rad21/Rec8-like protein N-terminal domain-containing protein n=1 Tax=Timema poppense TaxID=170557 RepID=A0A7R9D911_TIMPO|nr:unnamed protein product [Timema poppensis]